MATWRPVGVDDAINSSMSYDGHGTHPASLLTISMIQEHELSKITFYIQWGH